MSTQHRERSLVGLKKSLLLSRFSQRTWQKWKLCPETRCWTSWRRALRSLPSHIWSTLSMCGTIKARSFTMCWSSSTWRGFKASWSSTSTHCQKVRTREKLKVNWSLQDLWALKSHDSLTVTQFYHFKNYETDEMNVLKNVNIHWVISTWSKARK